MENKELFNNKTKEQPAQRQPMQLGLYDATNEHDACGVGMLVNIPTPQASCGNVSEHSRQQIT